MKTKKKNSRNIWASFLKPSTKEKKTRPSSTIEISNEDVPIANASSDYSATDLNKDEKNNLNRLLSLFTVRTKKEFQTISQLSARRVDYEKDSGKKWEEQDTVETLALIAQYESLRQESLNTINNRTQVMLLGIAAIGAIIGGSLTINDPLGKKFLIYTIYSGIVPFLCSFILLIWIGEAMRCHRVAYFIASEVEARINAKFGRLVLSWESSLWSGLLPRDEMFGPSMLSMAILGFISVFSPIFGFIYSGTKWIPFSQPLIVLGLPYLFLLMTVGYLLFNLKRIRNNPIIRSAVSKTTSNAST